MAEEILRPNGGGVAAYSYWTASAGDKWACVDEVTLDTADYVYRATTYSNENFAYADTSAASGQTINSVTVHAQCNAASGSQTIRLTVCSAAEQVQSGNLTVTTYYSDKAYVMATNPLTAAAWTSSEIDALYFGMTTRAITDQVNCAQHWIVVDYTAAGGVSIPVFMRSYRNRRT